MSYDFDRQMRNLRRRENYKRKKWEKFYYSLPIDPIVGNRYLVKNGIKILYRSDMTRYAYQCVKCECSWKIYQQECHYEACAA